MFRKAKIKHLFFIIICIMVISLRLKKKWKGSWIFSIINVYGRHNEYSIFYKKDNPTAISYNKLFGIYKLYIVGKPIPTITYNFIF
jgi:hypothetical protein